MGKYNFEKMEAYLSNENPPKTIAEWLKTLYVRFVETRFEHPGDINTDEVDFLYLLRTLAEVFDETYETEANS